MGKLFWVDSSRNRSITYKDFINDLSRCKSGKRYIYSRDPYEILLCITLAMLNGKEVELLDGDFTENDLVNFGISEEDLISTTYPIEDNKFDSVLQLLDTIKSNSLNFSLILYTSGTTGKPKKITHNLVSLTRGVKQGFRFDNDVWAFAYNPSHIAGLQVFFQAFFNQNTMVYIFDKSNKGRDAIQELLLNYKVTKISATPTFYRNILTYLEKEIPSVDTITSGGERFDHSLTEYISTIFPNARIKNIYASTEAGSLFISSGDYFVITKEIKDKIKISSANELLIHNSLLGKSNDYILSSEWYNTGDIVELFEDGKFKFVSRSSDFINIGGYRVNPIEIEELLLRLDCIKDILVYGRSNKITENVLAVDIVKSDEKLNEKEIQNTIKAYMEDKVQYWKVPRLFRFVEIIKQTRTGKKVRIK